MLILEDEGKRFSGRQFSIPQDLVDKLKEKQNLYSDDKYRTSRGFKRLNALLDKEYNQQSNKKERQHNNDYTVSFADVKRMDFDIRHMPQNSDNPEYDMIGGDDMRDFVHNTLDSLRNSVQQVQPVPEVPKLETNDVKPDVPKNIIKTGKVEVTLENKEFINKIKKTL